MRTYAPAEPGAVLDALLAEPSLARGVVHHAVLPPREAVFADFPGWLDPRIVSGLRLARHRAPVHPPGRGDGGGPRRRGRRDRHARPPRASRCATRSRSSSRSSTTRRRARSSCSRPRRSARTRWPSSASWPQRPACRSSPSTYDGDTPAPIRSAVRAAGQVVVTNPDMLHSAILPHHTKWFQLFEQLRVIVIDELHTYRGVFGGHVANVLRRLLRICAHYGSHAGHRLLLGDDREPGRAGGDADRPAGAARRPQRGAGRRAPRRPGRPAGHRARQRRARLGRHASPSAGHSPSCAPVARRSSSGGRGSRSSCC